MVDAYWIDISKGIRYHYYKVEYYKYECIDLKPFREEKVLDSTCMFSELDDAKLDVQDFTNKYLKENTRNHFVAYIYKMSHSEIIIDKNIVMNDEGEVILCREINHIK